MAFLDLPGTAAWRHGGPRTGFEVTSFERRDSGWRAVGSTTAMESGHTWWVGYEIDLDGAFTTRLAVISGRSGAGPESTVSIETDGRGTWTVDGRVAPHLDGCRDVDLESSAMTNAFPLRRLAFADGEEQQVPAVYVRVDGLRIERLPQVYRRRPDPGSGFAFDYRAPTFDFGCRIDYDRAGLVIDYPDIARRVA